MVWMMLIYEILSLEDKKTERNIENTTSSKDIRRIPNTLDYGSIGYYKKMRRK